MRLRAALTLVPIVAACGCGARSGLFWEADGADSGAETADAGRDAGLDAALDARAPATCGDAILDEGEECDLGAANADVPAYAVRQDDGRAFLPRPVGSPASDREFYDYRSESAHTGFEAPRRANLFLYDQTDRGGAPYLFMTFSQDEGGFDGTAEIDISGLGDAGDTIRLSDDPGPGINEGELRISGEGAVHGSFQWFSNSDGGIVVVACPREVTVRLGATTFIDEWTWGEPDGTLHELAMDRDLVIECHVTPSRCRTDCRLPACGDGFLDPQEECDDGNVRDGDGCPSDCDPP